MSKIKKKLPKDLNLVKTFPFWMKYNLRVQIYNDYSHHLKSLTKDSKEQQDENKQNGQVFDISSEHRPDMISPPADL
jgi:hypothetical protein